MLRFKLDPHRQIPKPSISISYEAHYNTTPLLKTSPLASFHTKGQIISAGPEHVLVYSLESPQLPSHTIFKYPGVLGLDVRGDDEKCVCACRDQVATIDLYKGVTDAVFEGIPHCKFAKYNPETQKLLCALLSEQIGIFDTRIKAIGLQIHSAISRTTLKKTASKSRHVISDAVWMGERKIALSLRSSGEILVYDARHSVKPYTILSGRRSVSSLWYNNGYGYACETQGIRVFTYNSWVEDWNGPEGLMVGQGEVVSVYGSGSIWSRDVKGGEWAESRGGGDYGRGCYCPVVRVTSLVGDGFMGNYRVLR